MNYDQFMKLEEVEIVPQEVRVSDLSDISNRTLFWGYTCDRNSFHVYLYNGYMELIIYNHKNEVITYLGRREAIAADELVPDKRLYPEACDYEFARLVTERKTTKGVGLPFTTYNHNRPAKIYYGAIAEHLKDAPADIERANFNRFKSNA